MRTSTLGWLAAAVALAGCAEAAPLPTHEGAYESLIAADRAWSQSAATLPYPDAIASVLADDAFVLLARGRSAQGPDAARAALAPEAGSHATWNTAWGGVSADGTQGFTLGYLTVQPASGPAQPGKYLAYWRRTPDGWRVVAWKRRPRPAGEVAPSLGAPLLPTGAYEGGGDAKAIAATVDARERAFSDEAARVGLGPAFVRFGHPRGVNMGGPENPGFVVGPEAIGAAVSEGQPAGGSSLTWWPDRIVAAASGDLALSIGTLHPNEAPKEEGVPREFPFFTVWYREGGQGDWRYIAE